MKQRIKTVLISNTVHIETAQIPRHVGENIAQMALRAIQRDYADPAVQEDYRRWKAERTTAKGGEVSG